MAPTQPPPASAGPYNFDMAQRLEHVRTRIARVGSLRAFYEILIADWPITRGKPFSYESVRYYHVSREAPASYLARVVEVFPSVRLDWLVMGKGAPTVEEEEARQQASAAGAPADAATRHIIDAILDELPRGLRPSASLYTLLIRTWGVLFDEMEASNAWDGFMVSGTADPPTTLEEKQVRVARMLGRALAAPALAGGGTAAVWGWSADQYIAHVCEALLWLRIPFVESSAGRETKAAAAEKRPARSRKPEAKKRPAKRAAKKAKPRRKR